MKRSSIFTAMSLALALTFAACSDEEDTIVTSVSADDVTPIISYDGSAFTLENDNGWAVTRYRDRIAVTNYEYRVQYRLSWDGDSSDGEKASAVLKIAEVGKYLQTDTLDYLRVTDVEGLYFQYSFSSGGETGVIIVSQQ